MWTAQIFQQEINFPTDYNLGEGELPPPAPATTPLHLQEFGSRKQTWTLNPRPGKLAASRAMSPTGTGLCDYVLKLENIVVPFISLNDTDQLVDDYRVGLSQQIVLLTFKIHTSNNVGR